MTEQEHQRNAAVKPGQLNPKMLLAAALVMGALFCFKIEGIVRRQTYDTMCQRGDKHACQVAERWGGVKPLPPIGSPNYNKESCQGWGCTWVPPNGCICG